MRLPFLRPKPPAAPARGRAAAAVDDAAAIQAARTRARRRLVGALVLLVIGIVGFPLLFETRPRPLPVDTPIEIVRRGDGAVQQGAIQPVTQQPEPRPPPAVPPPDAGDETTGGAAQANTPAHSTAATPSAAAPRAQPSPAAAVRPVPVVAAARAAASTPAAAVPATASTPAPPTTTAAAASAPPVAAPAADAGRYVVQVGAYSDAAALRDARGKVERMGLKTYTQVIDTPAGQRTRVRVGPFASRDEADAVAAKVKRGGLPANIIVL